METTKTAHRVRFNAPRDYSTNHAPWTCTCGKTGTTATGRASHVDTAWKKEGLR